MISSHGSRTVPTATMPTPFSIQQKGVIRGEWAQFFAVTTVTAGRGETFLDERAIPGRPDQRRAIAVEEVVVHFDLVR